MNTYKHDPVDETNPLDPRGKDKFTYGAGDLQITKKPPVKSFAELKQILDTGKELPMNPIMKARAEPPKSSLISHRENDWAITLRRIIAQAYNDHTKRLPRRTGQELRGMFVTDARKRHVRLCSTVYNQFRDELETSLDR